MTFRKRLLASSTGIAAILGLAGPAIAATDTDTSSASAVNEVVVTGIKESLQRAITIKRDSTDQVDAVSAEDIGKMPDKNVADALQRLPGVNTESSAAGEGGFDENDRVSIRGTSASLTQVTVDGHSIASGDWFILDQYQSVGRSVAFDLLPAEMVSSTTVYKTQDASLLEGGVAGVVNLQTPNALDLGGSSTPWVFEASAQGAYNSLRGDWKPQVNGEIGWKNADDTFGVAVQGFYEDRSSERYGQETLGYSTITSAMPIGEAHPNLVGVQAPTLIGSTLFQQERTREGGHVDIEWRPTDKLEFNVDGFYSHLDASNQNDNYMYWGSNELAKNLPTSYKVQNNTLVGAVWPQVAPNSALLTGAGTPNTAGTDVDGMIVDNIERPGSAAYTSYINLDAKYHATDHLTVSGQVGYTYGEGETDGAPSFEVDAPTGVSYGQSGNGWQVTPTNVNPQSPAGFSNDWSWNEDFTSKDSEIYGQVDAKYDIDDSVFKDVEAGFHGSDHTRQVDGWDRGCTLGANGACFSSPTMPFSATNPTSYPSGFSGSALGIPGLLIPIAGNPSTIDGILNNIPGGVRGPLSAIVTPQNYYWNLSFKVQEADYSGYLMSHIGGDGWRGNFGVRLVETDQQSFVNTAAAAGVPGAITTSAYGPYIVNDIKHNYFDILPSANLTFDLQKNLLLRVSAAETMSRPDYSALGAAVSLTDLTFTGNGGNPNLKPIVAGVYDAALEWYYAPTAVAAISLFYDDLTSYVGYGNSTGKYLDLQNSKIGVPGVANFYDYENFTISSPVNVSGQLKGVELQVQQPLPYNFGIQSNFTYVQGADENDEPLVGTSEITYNVVGYYEVALFDIRLAYTYRSHYFVGLDRATTENEAGNGQLDLSADFNITKNVTFDVQALNLTNSLLTYYANNPTQVRAVYDNGTQLYAGVRVKF
jgi:iron complex outermembrane receptor protein